MTDRASERYNYSDYGFNSLKIFHQKELAVKFMIKEIKKTINENYYHDQDYSFTDDDPQFNIKMDRLKKEKKFFVKKILKKGSNTSSWSSFKKKALDSENEEFILYEEDFEGNLTDMKWNLYEQVIN